DCHADLHLPRAAARHLPGAPACRRSRQLHHRPQRKPSRLRRGAAGSDAMNALLKEAAAIDWSDANQRLLVAELACLRARFTEEDMDRDALDAALAEAAAAMPAPGALDRVTAIFGLSTFERALLMLCAGVEMDSVIADACGAARRRSGPTFGLALAALE